MMTKSIIPAARQEALYRAFVAIIENYNKGLLTSRGLAHEAEAVTSPQELQALNDALLTHAFWTMRHLMQRPACWAPKPEELLYVLECLRGDDTFNQEIADSYRQ